jgi:outer membrane protein
VKVGFTYALNTTYSKLWAQNPVAMSQGDLATFPLGVGATLGNVATLGVEAGVFVTRNISLNVSSGIPAYVDDKTKGFNPQNPILTDGTLLARIMPGFVPITAVYHFDNFGASVLMQAPESRPASPCRTRTLSPLASMSAVRSVRCSRPGSTIC